MSRPGPWDRLRKRLKRGVWEVLDVAMPGRLLWRRGSAAQRRVALTFDDGPDPMTEQYLDVLDAFGVCASFFVNGDRAAERPELIVEMAARGHAIGVHGFTHRPLPGMSGAEIADELHATAEVLPPTPIPMVRPPYGSIDVRTALHCWRLGYALVMWSLDSMDGFEHDPTCVIDRVNSGTLRRGEVVLMHEGQRWTLEALPYILADLESAGIDAVTVPELFGEPV